MIDSPSAIRMISPCRSAKCSGSDPPATADADHDRAEVVDRERHEPDGDPHVPVEEAGQRDQEGADGRGRGEAEDRVKAVGIVACDSGGENQVEKADEEVGDPEEHRVVAEGAGNRQRGDQHRPHRGEHHQPDAALVDVSRARQPGVDAPRPPERRENEHPAEDASPRRVVREQSRDLRDREHEGQVEEELERRDLMLAVELGVGRLHPGHPSPARPTCRRSLRSPVGPVPQVHQAVAEALFLQELERQMDTVGQGPLPAAHDDRCEKELELVDQPCRERLGSEVGPAHREVAVG